VAYSVGFSSQAHMTDTFRKRLNVTPGELRQRNFVCLPSSAT
jgi:AraC family transcriptional regulator